MNDNQSFNFDYETFVNANNNSAEATILILAYYYLLGLMDDLKDDEVAHDQVCYGLIPLATQYISTIAMGDGDLEKQGGKVLPPNTPVCHELVSLVSKQLSNEIEEDTTILFYDQAIAKITNKFLQRMLFYLLLKIADKSNGFSETEAILLERTREKWEMDEDEVIMWGDTLSNDLYNEDGSINENGKLGKNEISKLKSMTLEQVFEDFNNSRENLVAYIKGEKKIEEKSGGGCFIATATLHENDFRLIDLRSFRDEVLANNFYGRSFIKIYYRKSPPIADFLKDSPILNKIVKYFLVVPVAFFTKNYMKYCKK